MPIRKSRAPKRILLKREGKIPRNAEKGEVVAAAGKHYLVKPVQEELISDNPVDCYAGGTVITPYDNYISVIVVGDRVYFTRQKNVVADNGLPAGTIVKVKERRTMLSRKTPGKRNDEHVIASNADSLLIIMSTKEPLYNRRLIDRCLIAAELGELNTAICINKIDLKAESQIRDDFSIYEKLDIPLFFVSAKENNGLEDVREYLKGKTTIFSGPSGAGKSTLLNSLLGEDVQTVRDISEKTGKGKHTTSLVRMFDFEDSGRIIDTPGIREFGIYGVEKGELGLYFHDFDEFQFDCKYLPCTHTHEPECAVKDALEKGLIDPERYESYLNIYESEDG